MNFGFWYAEATIRPRPESKEPGETFLDKESWDGIVGRQVDTPAMHGDCHAGCHVNQDRAGAAAKSGTVVLQLALLRINSKDLARGEALDVVNALVDEIHESGVWNP